VSRPGVAITLSVLFVLAVSAIQRYVTSPGRTTYGEFRLLVLAGIPALVTIASAFWVDNGRRDQDRG
jgi:hypothetical protein